MKVINRFSVRQVKGNASSGTIVSIISDILGMLVKTDGMSEARLKEMELDKQITKTVKSIYDKMLNDLLKNEKLEGSTAILKLDKMYVTKFVALLKGNTNLKYKIHQNTSILKSSKTIVEVKYEKSN